MIETKSTVGTVAGTATLTEPRPGELGRALSPPSAAPLLADSSPAVAVESPWPRVLGHLPGRAHAPTLIVVAALHGNEPSGVLALERVIRRLEAERHAVAGSFVALVGNRRALGLRQRFVDEDLNRIWRRGRLDELRAGQPPASAEESEMLALDLELRAAIDNADAAVYLLDLHTTSAPGPAFSVLNDTLPNRDFALKVPAPTVLGLEEELSGTLLSYLAGNFELRSMGFESGQHDDLLAIDHAEAGIWIVLAESGVLDEPAWPEVAAARDTLERATRHLPRLVDVQYRHAITASDGFRMHPGFRGFQRVRRGDVLGDDHRGEVCASMDGLLLMPLYQGKGDDGFFIVRTVRPFWLRLSALMRRWHLVERLHWLPGIRRHPSLEDALIVDKRVAVVLAVELFHLMGFTRVGPVGERFVTMRRRAFDR